MLSDYDGMIEFGVSKQDHTDRAVRGMSSIVADNHKGGRIFEYNNKSKTYF